MMKFQVGDKVWSPKYGRIMEIDCLRFYPILDIYKVGFVGTAWDDNELETDVIEESIYNSPLMKALREE